MADIFRKTLDSLCCLGGVKCNKCNSSFWGKDRAKLNRLARTKLKRQDEKELKELKELTNI